MISKILLTGLMTFFLSGGISSDTEDFDKVENNIVNVTVTDDISKGILYNGEVIPLVELPTVEITGKRNFNGLVKATMEDGQAFPLYELPEVVITPGA